MQTNAISPQPRLNAQSGDMPGVRIVGWRCAALFCLRQPRLRA